MGAILMTMFTTSPNTGSMQTSAGQAFGLANTTSPLTPLMAYTPFRHELPVAVGPAPPKSRKRAREQQHPEGSSAIKASGTGSGKYYDAVIQYFLHWCYTVRAFKTFSYRFVRFHGSASRPHCWNSASGGEWQGENDLKYSSVLAPLAIMVLTHEKYVSHD